MCKLKIDLDSYEDFFINGAGRELISKIIQNGDHDEVECIAEWKKCDPKVLAEIAECFMKEGKSDKETKKNIELLEEIAENPNVSIKTLRDLFKFATVMLESFRCYSGELLEKIAESKSLDEELSQNVYQGAKKSSDNDAIKALSENEKTSDKVLIDIIHVSDGNSAECVAATKQIVRRYRQLKKDLNTDK